jgi:hypothetical protein
MASSEREAIASDAAAHGMPIVVLEVALPSIVAWPAYGLEVLGVERTIGCGSAWHDVIHGHALGRLAVALAAIGEAPQMLGSELPPGRRIVERSGLGLGGEVDLLHGGHPISPSHLPTM